MIAYSYDPETKEYIGESFCQPYQLHGGFLIPGSATDIKPEQPKEGHVMIFKDEGWVEVKDDRGQIWCVKDKLSIEWKKLEPIPEDYTKLCPKPMDHLWDEENKKLHGHDEILKEIEEEKKKRKEQEQTYQFKRRVSYPPLFEQLDALYWDMKNGTDNWIKSRDKIKEQFPKEE